MISKKHIVTPNVGIIILAAGASRRMGSPKQLLKIGQQTLLERIVELTKEIHNQETVVVLGANAQKIKQAVNDQNEVTFIINEDWKKGMGTTLKTGINYFLKKKELIEAVIVLVCDQPYLTSNILKALINQYVETKADIVATAYAKIKGVPALFSKKIFPQLANLQQDKGARKIIKKYQGQIVTVNFPKGQIDLDTPSTYQAFLEKYEENQKNGA
ncbi:MAG: nucleotidyltransferase family protein [Bacteroidota bacterium]